MKTFLGVAVPLVGLASWYIDPYLSGTAEKNIVFALIFFVTLIAFSISGLKTYSPNLSIPLILLYIAMVGFWFSTLFGLESRSYSVRDWGVGILQSLVPFAVMLFPDKDKFLKRILIICVCLATVDFIVNIAAIFGLLEIVTSGRMDQYGFRVRYQGISGNSHAAGLVGFLGLFYIGTIIRTSKYLVPLAALTVCLFFSMYLIDARRYLVMAIFAWGILLTPARHKNVAWTTVFLAGAMIAATFTADFADGGNRLRADLIQRGLDRALDHPFLGEGPKFLDMEGIKQTYLWMSDAGITESTVLELCRNYGILSTVVFLAAMISSLPNRYYPPAILLALMTGELFFGGAITGYFGGPIFFACFHACVELRAKPPIPAGSSPGFAPAVVPDAFRARQNPFGSADAMMREGRSTQP